MDHFWLGMAIIFFSGVFNGSFALPMKFIRRWHWENLWLVFALVGILAMPILLAITFVPRWGEVLRGTSSHALAYPLVFGFLWGIAQVTFGLGIKAMGMAFAFAVVSGLACLSGSLAPLLVLNPSDLFRSRGLFLLASMPLLFLGLILCGKAGRRREKDLSFPGSTPESPGGKFMTGLAICIFTGIFGSSFNLGFAFSGDILRKSMELGARQVTATYGVWALVFSAGFIPNLLYCVYLLFRNSSWSLFREAGWMREAMLAVAMALLWLGGVTSYGIGAILVGRYGTSVGFVLFMASSILSANVLGLLTGEWKAAQTGTRRLLWAGVAAILASILVLNLGGVLA
jgi:L-rhamnose-H+ transport protein